MRSLMILVFAAFSFNIALTAQVKDQFRDRENSSTIVVVKEDNAIDQKVLNEYFDLAEMSMSDQIMIMTVPEETPTISAPDMETALASTDDNNIEDFFESLETEEAEVVSPSTAEVSAKVEVEIAEVETKDAINVSNERKPFTVRTNKRVVSTRARGTYTVKNSADVKQAAKKKYFGKKKRRKNNRNLFWKKNSKKCYSF